MKKHLTSLIGLILLAGSLSAFAQAGTKIAVVDAEMVIQNSIKGKRFFKQMEDFGKNRTDSIKAKVDAYKEKEKELQTKLSSLSEDKRKSMGLELQKMETEIKRMQEDAKRESDVMINDALDKFRRELIPVIESVATSKSVDMVFNIGPGTNIAYVNKAIDLTADVVKAYDATVKD
ncbi:MAG: OmpH family outer membrane protein [Acidobacteria bacterium]|nr:OmpH family outer membrane protein [Acidobacteriota bacterium]MCB9398129.1 OmpH family outer membrane protein [Acidobacteriota bacterium]